MTAGIPSVFIGQFINRKFPRNLEERKKSERRDWRRKVTYPFIDSDGNLVTHNRRRTVDRRIDSTGGEEPEAMPDRTLLLRFQGQMKEITKDSDKATLGRGNDSDIRVVNRIVSRRHALIRLHKEGFLLIDVSTNGTFVLFEDGEAVRALKEEIFLPRDGAISLGKPVHEYDEDLIQFRFFRSTVIE